MGERKVLQTDVVVVGGGAAGCMAAIRGLEKGVKVIVIDKSTIAKSGNAGAGNKDLTCHLNEGEPWDTDAAASDWWCRSGMPETNPFLDLEVVDINIRRIKEVVRRLESYGTEFLRDSNGRYYRSQALGTPGPYLLWFKNGHELKPRLAQQVRKLGAKILERVFVVDLLIDNGRIKGIVAFNLNDLTICVIYAKAIILATGEAIRLYSNSQTHNPWSTWHSPYNNGTSQALAFNAGAEISGLEFTKTTLHPVGFGAPGAAVFYGLGGYLLNSKGERYLEKYHPMGERGPRHILVMATLNEIAEGRGPCFLDCRHVPPDRIDLMEKLQFAEFLGYQYYFRQLKIDLRKNLVQMEVGNLFATGGILIDGLCRTTVPGLFAAGDCTQAQYGLPMALTTGLEAGEHAADFAIRFARDASTVLSEQIEAIEKKIISPLERRDGISSTDFCNRLNKVMDEYVGWRRTEESLQRGLRELDLLESIVERIGANNSHELMRVYEASHLLTVAKLVAVGALERRESRGWHSREDYPIENDTLRGHIRLRRSQSGEVVKVQST
jgi:adenylylsulfate reductase, subunit A